jgi:pimeloyl-ACP methyl ester carboxylesterase
MPGGLPSTSATTTYHRALVDGVGAFYREAGPQDAPTIVLLHGFPSSSRMFDALFPLLAGRYHLVASDYPGFGQSNAPPPSQYAYTFDHLAETIQEALLYDYRTNVAAYPLWQAWLRLRQPPTLVVWGGYDGSFITPGAEAYEQDLPSAEVHVLDSGHFALDEKVHEIAALMLVFLKSHLG